MEFKFPFFNDIWRMHWLVQPFAVLSNLVFGLLAFVAVVLFYVIYVGACAVLFVLAIPVIIVSEIWDWISKF